MAEENDEKVPGSKTALRRGLLEIGNIRRVNSLTGKRRIAPEEARRAREIFIEELRKRP